MSRARLAMLACLAVMLACSSLQAQETVARIRESGARAFMEGDFAEALPYFEQLIEIQGGSKVQDGQDDAADRAAALERRAG